MSQLRCHPPESTAALGGSKCRAVGELVVHRLKGPMAKHRHGSRAAWADLFRVARLADGRLIAEGHHPHGMGQGPGLSLGFQPRNHLLRGNDRCSKRLSGSSARATWRPRAAQFSICSAALR